MPRTIALDYGRKRCGLAHTDPEARIATALATVPTPELMAYLLAYPYWNEVTDMVVGLPLQHDQTPSENAARTLRFCRQMRQRWAELPIYLLDERFTSILAQNSLLESGTSKSKRQRKDLVDQVAAVLILQDFMRMHDQGLLHRLPRWEQELVQASSENTPTRL